MSRDRSESDTTQLLGGDLRLNLATKPLIVALSAAIGLALSGGASIVALKSIQLVPDKIEHKVTGTTDVTLNLFIHGLGDLKPVGDGKIQIIIPAIDVNLPSEFHGKVDDVRVKVENE